MALNLYLDLQNQKLVPSVYSTNKITSMDLMLRDTYPIALYLLSEQSNTSQPYVIGDLLAAGETIAFGAKEDEDDADFLFSQSTWTKSGSGTTTKYFADLSLNTAALIDAIGDDDDLTVKAEFTVVGTSNENRYSTKFSIKVIKDVISGSEGVPSTEFPVVAQYTDDNGVAAVRLVNSAGVCMGLFKNGAPYVFCVETGLWYPLSINIIDSIPVLSTGAGENI
jgi:hypothetical protein